MRNIDVIIPVFSVPMETIRNKLLPIFDEMPEQTKITVCFYCPAPEKSYVPKTGEVIDVEAEYEQSVQQWIDDLNANFRKYASQYGCVKITEKDIAQRWLDRSHNEVINLLVLLLGERNKLPIYRMIIRSTDIPILALFNKPWSHPLTIAAAIDPFHDNDKDNKRDVRVVNVCEEVAEYMNGKVSLLHCCNVPAYLTEYKKEVRNYRMQSVELFAEDSGFGSLKITVLNGTPKNEICDYVNENDIDILGMGSVSRGLWERYVMGSTADGLLSDPPCDLLLLRK